MYSADQQDWNATAVAERGNRSGARETQRVAKRETILGAAITLFAARGFEGTSLPAITTACGVPVPLIIYHFRSKEQLWRDAVDEVYGRLATHLAGFAEEIATATGVDYYRANIRAHITGIATHPEYMRILFQEGTQDSERLRWLVDRHQSAMTAMIVRVIERGQREGYVADVDLIHAKFVLSGGFVFPIVLAAEYKLVTGEDPLDPAFVERHIDTCLRLLLPKLPLPMHSE